MTTKELSIKDRFYNMPLTEQVIVYAEALYTEKYELLAVLKNLIHTKHKPVFNKLVDDYLVGKYGKKKNR